MMFCVLSLLRLTENGQSVAKYSKLFNKSCTDLGFLEHSQ
jgi:hypothetical protein